MNRPATILHLLVTLGLGGAERVVYDLCRRIDRSRFRPLVAALDAHGPFADRLHEASVPVLHLDARRWRHLPLALARVRRAIRSTGADLLHTHLLAPNLIGRLAAWGTGVPVLSTCHIVERRPMRGRLLLDRATAPLATAEVCVSGAVAAFQRQIVPRLSRETHVIPNGVDLARFARPGAREALRNELGLDDATPLLGAVGRLDRQKGFDLLLDALVRPELAQRPWHALLVGEGPEEEALRRQAGGMPAAERIHLLGPRPAEAILPALDLCILPSRWEGFGLVAVEAMAAGAPVVAASVDSLPEVLGPAARLVPPEDPESLADAIASLLDDPPARAALAQAGRARAERYRLETMVRAYEDLYDALLERGGASPPLPAP